MNGPAMVVPPPMQPLISAANVKDSRWLTLEVCREFIRNKCTRSDQECKFAHPPPHVEVQNGRVTCCFDSIKGKCQRKDPPCKYLHPPQHLKEQLLQNGRNNLILRNLQWQALTGGIQPGVAQTVMYDATNTNGKAAVFSNAVYAPTQQPTLLGPLGNYCFPGATGLGTYVNQGTPTILPNVLSQLDGSTGMSMPVSVSSPSQLATVPGHNTSLGPKVTRADRLESSTAVSASSGVMSNSWNGHPTHVSPADTPVVSSASHFNHPVYFQPTPMVEVIGASNKRTRDPADDLLLSMNALPGMVPIVKRSAVDGKSGMAMYPSAPASATYQQALAAMQIQQQYVPVTIAGHPPSMPRF